MHSIFPVFFLILLDDLLLLLLRIVSQPLESYALLLHLPRIVPVLEDTGPDLLVGFPEVVQLRGIVVRLHLLHVHHGRHGLLLVDREQRLVILALPVLIPKPRLFPLECLPAPGLLLLVGVALVDLSLGQVVQARHLELFVLPLRLLPLPDAFPVLRHHCVLISF